MFNIPDKTIRQISSQYGTPVWIYDADHIRKQVLSLKKFDIIRFAQKACSNVHILRLMRDLGVMTDAVSYGEIKRSLAAGYEPQSHSESMVFTADVIDRQTLDLVAQHGIPVNGGSLDMVKMVGENLPGHPVWLRINPGFGHGHSRKTNTGGDHSKHGIWYSEISKAVEYIKKYKLDLVGLHMHIGSGCDSQHLAKVCDTMVEHVCNLGHKIRAISAGGGLPVPYKDEDPTIDVDHYFELWDQARKKIEQHLNQKVQLEIEPGRYLVAGAGILVSEVLALKSTPAHRFIVVDAGFNDLARPAFYGSYHGVRVLAREEGQELSSKGQVDDFAIAGPLCESGDIFTQDADNSINHRRLPVPELHDYLVFEDAGAYGASMSSNYNSRPLAPEVLVDGGEIKLIRRRQTVDDLIALEE